MGSVGKFYKLTTTLREHLNGIAAAVQYNRIVLTLDRYVEQLSGWTSAPAVMVSGALHRLAGEILCEDIVQQQAEEIIRCRKGCAHCCKQLVMVSEPEGRTLFLHAQRHGMALPLAKIERQSGRDDAGWLALPPEDRGCIFLGSDNSCQVYDIRPLSCRKYFAISDPALCDTEKFPSGRVAIWYSLDVEVVTSAAFTALGSGSLASVIGRHLRHEYRSRWRSQFIKMPKNQLYFCDDYHYNLARKGRLLAPVTA